MEYKQVVEQFGKSVRKQGPGHLPRTRCVATFQERLEFILPEGTEALTFCRGTKTLDPSRLVFPQTQPELQSVIVNFDTGMIVFVMPEPAPGVGRE